VYGRADSTRTMIVGFCTRVAVMFLVVVLLYISNIGNILCALIGMFAIKISVYLQPYLQKIAAKILKKGG